MIGTTLADVERLVEQLSPEERLRLVERLERPVRQTNVDAGQLWQSHDVSGSGSDRFSVETGLESLRRENQDVWRREKEALLSTHRGWFVAYREGKRVALEPSLDRLIATLQATFGTPRQPCEFHGIGETPVVRRGPSPRLRPAQVQ